MQNEEINPPRTESDFVPALPPVPTLSDFPRAVPLDEAPLDVLGSNFYPDTSTSQLLSDMPVGSGTVSNETLALSVPFIVGTSHPDLITRDIRVVQRSSRQRALVIVVENVGDDRLCDVSLSGVRAIYPGGQAYLQAFVPDRVIGARTLTVAGGRESFCIEPRSLAYALNTSHRLDGLVLSNTESFGIYVRRIDAGAATSVPSIDDAKPEAVSYRVSDDRIFVDVLNKSTQLVLINSITLLLLNENGQVTGTRTVYSGFRRIEAGESATFMDRFYSTTAFDGTASSLRAIVSFAPTNI